MPWFSRLLIGLVFAWNVQAALVFMFDPAAFAAAYELSGAAGEAAVRGFGVLSLMWNVPYAAALWHPLRFRLALTLAVVMQSIGVIGEGFILLSLPEGHAALRASIVRFVLFDAAGVILLLAAAWLMKWEGRAR